MSRANFCCRRSAIRLAPISSTPGIVAQRSSTAWGIDEGLPGSGAPPTTRADAVGKAPAAMSRPASAAVKIPTPISTIMLPVMAAVTHDLQAISHLVTLADQLHAAVQKQTSIPFPPLPVRNPEPRPTSTGAGRLVAPTWDDLMGPMGATHLAAHYTRHGGGHFARARAFVWTGAKTGSPLGALDPVTAPDDVHAADLVGRRTRLRQYLACALDGAARRIVRRGALFPDDGTAIAGIVDDEIGECASDVDADGIHVLIL